jgi:four helix bundle protein
MEIVVEVYRVSSGFPRAETYGLTSQIRRAAVSVPSNIAEGHSRATTREYLNHVSIAQASLAEVETQLEIARRLGFTGDEQVGGLLNQSAVLGRQLYALREALEKRK